MGKTRNPYRCKFCGKLAPQTLVCKACLRDALETSEIKEQKPEPKEGICRIENCGKPIHYVGEMATELCKKHFYGEELPLVRKTFVTDINFGGRQTSTPGAIPVKSDFDLRRIEGWK